MRIVALASLLISFSAAAQVPQSEPQPTRTTNEGTLTIKIDAQPQKPPTSPVAEYLRFFLSWYERWHGRFYLEF
jgi:hypothetical protein